MSSQMSHLKKWFVFNKLYTQNKDYTHLLLDGGKINIPREREDEFFSKCAADMFIGNKNYVCEQKTNIFKAHADLDFENDDEMKYEDIIKIVKNIQLSLGIFYDKKLISDERRVIICTTDPKEKIKDNKKIIKTGVHLIWPEILMDKNTALMVRQFIIENLRKEFGERINCNNWDDVVDETVYTNNGLRMVGCAKMVICSNCKNNINKKKNCEKCNKIGRIDEGRIYKPVDVITGDGDLNKKYLDELENNLHYQLQQTSIRVYTDSYTNYDIPDGFVYIKKKISKKNKINKKSKSGIIKNDDIKKFKLNSTDQRFIKVEAFIKKTFKNKNSFFKDMNIVEVIEVNDAEYYLVRTDCHYCPNVKREHGSNTIYFHIDKQNLYIKCFSIKKDNVCDSSDCSKYKSEPYKLTKTLINILYNKSNSIVNKKFKNKNEKILEVQKFLLRELENKILSKN